MATATTVTCDLCDKMLKTSEGVKVRDWHLVQLRTNSSMSWRDFDVCPDCFTQSTDHDRGHQVSLLRRILGVFGRGHHKQGESLG